MPPERYASICSRKGLHTDDNAFSEVCLSPTTSGEKRGLLPFSPTTGVTLDATEARPASWEIRQDEQRGRNSTKSNQKSRRPCITLNTASKLNRDPSFIREAMPTAKDKPRNSWKNLYRSWEQGLAETESRSIRHPGFGQPDHWSREEARRDQTAGSSRKAA